MNRVNFGRVSGVIVDQCAVHGTWFDADELPRVIEFVLAGGMEKSRKAEVRDLEERADRARSSAMGAPLLATHDDDLRRDMRDLRMTGRFLSTIARLLLG
jgi:hypothetical protein